MDKYNKTMGSETIVRRPEKRKHRKSKFGCPQCREKKVKCDESLPVCLGCRRRSLRCGYLDLTDREVHLIRISHWEKEGSDPSKNPVPSQQFNPHLNQVIIQHNVESLYDIDRFYNGLDGFSSNFTHSVPPHNHYTYHHQQNRHSYETHNHSYGNDPVSQLPVTPMFTNDQFLTPSFSRTNYSDPSSGSSFFSSPENYDSVYSFTLPLIKHSSLPFKDHSGSQFFDDFIQDHPSRCSVLKRLHNQISSASSNPNDQVLFNSLLLFSTGSLLAKHPQLDRIFLRYRGTCIKYLLKELPNVNSTTCEQLLNVTTYLDSSSVFFKGHDDIFNYKSFISITSGASSLLKKIYEDPSNFPTVLPNVRLHTDCMLSSANFVWSKCYDQNVLVEFYEIVKTFGQKYISVSRFPKGDTIFKQYKDLVDLLKFALDLLTSPLIDDPSNYPIEKLFELVQKWYSIIPSECFTFNSNESPIRNVFYTLWFPLMHLLEAILPKSRLIFPYFLNGNLSFHIFPKEDIQKQLQKNTDISLIWIFNYSCRIISFFIRRDSYILNNSYPKTIANLKDKLSQLNTFEVFNEVCVESFTSTTIKQSNYPRFIPDKDTNIIQSHMLYCVDLMKDQEEISKGTIPNSQSKKVDLLNDISTSTSLSNKDYCPISLRMSGEAENDGHFNGDYTHLINSYVEARRIFTEQ